MEESRLAGAGETGEAWGETEAQQCSNEAIATGNVKAALPTLLPGQRERHATSLVPDLRSPLLPTMEGLWQLTLHWQPSEHQQAQFQQLYALTLAGNRQFNLTRITEPAEFWEKHLWDSLRGVQRFLAAVENQEPGLTNQQPELAQDTLVTQHSTRPNSVAHLRSSSQRASATQNTSFKVIDIGTGAGFPGLPVAIAQPNWAVTLLDATRKKITFLDQVLANLELAHSTTLVERVENVGRQKHQRQTYDLALIRAVAAATVCAEYALPLLKIGGCAVLYRGQWTDAETASLESAVTVLGGKIDAIEAFTTPMTQSDRHCIYLKKIASTPNEFPRAIGTPTQKPLGSQDGAEHTPRNQ